LGFSWLWAHLQYIGFEVQGTIYGVCGGEKGFSIFGNKTSCFVSNFEGSKTICLKDYFIHPLIKVWEKLQPLLAKCKE
jgi:hypothetical protein